jgi:polyhydroxyalkanoate synthase
VTSVENPTTNGHPRTATDAGNVAAARAALDVMLTDAAVSQGRASRFLDPAATAKLTGALASVFPWLRPNDLIWNYVVNNYWLGNEPPAFDILCWNQDGVRLAAGLHRDFVKLAIQNALATPRGFTVLRTPLDLNEVTAGSYIVAGASDRIVPWRNAYASTQLLGGDARFVLPASGHIQAFINPPSPDDRFSYQIADEYPADPDDWRAGTVTKRGSWWPDYIAWLSTRSGALKPAPTTLGNRQYKAQAKAPGSSVDAA